MSYTPTIWKIGDIITAQKLNKMEDAIHTILSDYIQTNWVDGETISAEKLNKLEDAIEYVNLDYVKTVWKNNDIITASLLNNMEIGIEAASVDKTWEEMNWNDIIVATRTGKYRTFNVGDMKELDLGTEGIIHMEIVGIDTDDLADGSGKAPLTFISRELLNTSHRMNPTLTPDSAPYDEGTGSIGGWEKCEIRAFLKQSIKPLILANLRNAIKVVTKYSSIFDISGVNTQNGISTDDVWIPSSQEIFGNVGYESDGQYYNDAFPDDESRKKATTGTDTDQRWWLRSASIAQYPAKNFRCVRNIGDHSNYAPQNTCGIALGFCL